MRCHYLSLFLVLATLLTSGEAFAIYPDELYVFKHTTDSCVAQIETEEIEAENVECYFGKRHPCVASEISGYHSIQDVLNQLSDNMSGFAFSTETKMCDIDENIRLVLLRPDTLTDARIEVTSAELARSIIDYTKTIASKINSALKVSVPEEEHLIIAGYKTMYHSRCLGNVCDGIGVGNAAYGHFPLEQVVNDQMEEVPFYLSLGHPNPRHNWILDCDFFSQLAPPVICNPNDGTVATDENGYHAEIILEGNPGDALTFEVHGKLSLRYLDIYLKSRNSKVVFTGQGVVELTQVSIYGDAETDAMVEFGPGIQVQLRKNPKRPRTLFSYGLGLHPRHAGIDNYITSSNLGVLATLTHYTRQDLLYPELKLAIPTGLNPPIPFHSTEQPFALPCFINEEAGECQLEDESVPIIVTLKPQNGHLVQQEPIVISDRMVPLVENGFYYSLAWKQLRVLESPSDNRPSADKSLPTTNDWKKKFFPGGESDETDGGTGVVCAEGYEVRSGICFPVGEAELPPDDGGDASQTDNDDDDDSPPGPRLTLRGENENGCSLNLNGRVSTLGILWILLLFLIVIRHRFCLKLFFLLFPLLILSNASAQDYPEALTVLNGGEAITSRKPCVVLNETGGSSVQNILERLDTSMVPPRDFFYDSNPNDCSLPKESDSSPNVRLVLFKPDGLTDNSNYVSLPKAIDSKITRSLHLTVPNEEHLIVAGYKTMYHRGCLGRDCNKKAWGGCLQGSFGSLLELDWDSERNQCAKPMVYKLYTEQAFQTHVNETFCYAQFDPYHCVDFLRLMRSNPTKYDWPACVTGNNGTIYNNQTYLNVTQFPYSIDRSNFTWPNPPSDLAEHCETILGPVVDALGYSQYKENYRRASEGSLEEGWSHFPITEDIANDNLDFTKNPVFDCNYFNTHKATTICNGDEGYRAEIGFEPSDDFFEGGDHDLVFEVNGKLSLRYLNIRLKSSNSKVKFIGRGTVEFTEVAIYGEAVTRTMVEFGPEIDVVLHKNPGRPVTQGSYGLALFPQGIGIRNYITASNGRPLVAFNDYTLQDLSYPKLKLVIPGEIGTPNPFYFTEQPFALPCYLNEEGDECQLEDESVSTIVTFMPQNGHLVRQQPIVISGGIVPLVENGFYYSLAYYGLMWKQLRVLESPPSDPPAASPSDRYYWKKKFPQNAGADETDGGTGVVCSEGYEVRSGICFPLGEGELPPDDGGDAIQADEDDDDDPPPGPPSPGLAPKADGESGCLLNLGGGTKRGIIWIPLFLLILLNYRHAATTKKNISSLRGDI